MDERDAQATRLLMPTSRGSLRPGAAISQQDAVHGAAPGQQPARVLTFRPRARSGSGDASRSATSLRSAGDRVVIRLDERRASRQPPPEKFPKGGWLIVAVGLAPLFAFLWKFLPR
jgi:hypothetical protein